MTKKTLDTITITTSKTAEALSHVTHSPLSTDTLALLQTLVEMGESCNHTIDFELKHAIRNHLLYGSATVQEQNELHNLLTAIKWRTQGSSRNKKAPT